MVLPYIRGLHSDANTDYLSPVPVTLRRPGHPNEQPQINKESSVKRSICVTEQVAGGCDLT